MDIKRIEMELPWCPSANHYLMVSGKSRFLSPAAKKFRKDVEYLAFLFSMEQHIQLPLTGRLRVDVKLYPPDKRKRDIDNCSKNLLDALQHGDVFVDDNQVDELYLKRCTTDAPHGRIEIIVTEL